MSIDVLDILRSKQIDPNAFDFDALVGPSVYSFLSTLDIEALNKAAGSIRMKINQKYKAIDNIMRNRGFRRFAGGTNRVVYAHYENPNILAKIALDRVGMGDNIAEYNNQHILKPFVAKTFSVTQCGTVAISEKVVPITSLAAFKDIEDDVFDIIANKFLRKHVMDDIGYDYFMNWGIRIGFAPVLLDYPYLYAFDMKKIHCKEILKDGSVCNGLIGYDKGLSNIYCNKCGKRYKAYDLRLESNEINYVSSVATSNNNKRGGTGMKIELVSGNTVIDTITTPSTIMAPTKDRTPTKIKCCLYDPTKGYVDEAKEEPVLHDIPEGFEPMPEENTESDTSDSQQSDPVSDFVDSYKDTSVKDEEEPFEPIEDDVSSRDNASPYDASNDSELVLGGNTIMIDDNTSITTVNSTYRDPSGLNDIKTRKQNYDNSGYHGGSSKTISSAKKFSSGKVIVNSWNSPNNLR